MWCWYFHQACAVHLGDLYGQYYFRISLKTLRNCLSVKENKTSIISKTHGWLRVISRGFPTMSYRYTHDWNFVILMQINKHYLHSLLYECNCSYQNDNYKRLIIILIKFLTIHASLISPRSTCTYRKRISNGFHLLCIYDPLLRWHLCRA